MPETVRIQPMDGPWLTLGAGRLSHLRPQGIQAAYTSQGPDSLAFDLEVDPRRFLELREFIPIEYYEGSSAEPDWSGFLTDTPRRAGGVGVQARGWRYHTDDHSHPLFYVHERLGDWQDARSFPLIYPNSWVTSWHVDGGTGQWAITHAKGEETTTSTRGGIMLDCGPDPDAWPAAMYLAWAPVGGGWTVNTNELHVEAYDQPSPGTGQNHQVYNSSANTAQGVLLDLTKSNGGVSGDSPRRRFLTIFVWRQGATFSPLAADEGARITAIQLYRDSAYFIGGGINRGDLRATDVFLEETLRCPRLSSDTSRIVQTTFGIRALGGPGEEATPGEAMARANSYHGYRWGVDAQRRVYLQPQPATPELQVNTADAGVDYQDTSHNSSAEVYNVAVVVGTQGDGTPVREVRSSGDLPGAVTILEPAVRQPANPGAEVDASGWTASGAGAPTVTRDTTRADTGAASIKVAAGGFSASDLQITGAWPAGDWFEEGFLYTLTFKVRLNRSAGAVNPPAESWIIAFGEPPPSTQNQYQHMAADNEAAATESINVDSTTLGTTNGWYTVTRQWRPYRRVRTQDVVVRFQYLSGNGNTYNAINIDSLMVTRKVLSVPDRMGFQRSKTLEVQAPTDPTTARLLGDLFLQAHARPPFKGSLAVAGDVVTEILTGRNVPAAELARRSGELIRLADVEDPYLGHKGRDAIMLSSTKAGNQVQVALDDDRGSLEALMARMQVVQGK